MSHPARSPSGLLTRAMWRSDVGLDSGFAPRGLRRATADVQTAKFLAWVEAEALGLAAQLGRLRTPDDVTLAAAIEITRNALLSDARWASEQAGAPGPQPIAAE